MQHVRLNGGSGGPSVRPPGGIELRLRAHELRLPKGDRLAFSPFAPGGRDFGVSHKYLSLLCPRELARAQVEPQDFHLAGEAYERAYAAVRRFRRSISVAGPSFVAYATRPAERAASTPAAGIPGLTLQAIQPL